MEAAFITMGCVLFSICLIIVIISSRNLNSARKTIKEAKNRESKSRLIEEQLNIKLKECYIRLENLRKSLIKSLVKSAEKYNIENNLDFYKKETIITKKITEVVNEMFNDFDDIMPEDLDNFDEQLKAFNSFLNSVLSIKSLAITIYYSLDLEVMQPACNYNKNIDTIIDFISESINNPEFDIFTSEDTKNYLKSKFNQPSIV